MRKLLCLTGKITAFLAVILTATAVRAGEWDLSGSIGFELRSFIEKGPGPGQLSSFQPSVVVEGDVRWSNSAGNLDLVFIPFSRIDARDDRRSHSDIREGYIRWTKDNWDIRGGYGKVFWGVAESRHLVDIINQSDTIEDIDEEDKFGQLMLEITNSQDWGTLSLWLLPDFKERIFPGRNGRLRTPFLVSNEDAFFSDTRNQNIVGNFDESPSGLDIAGRYSHYFGDIDIGLSFFHGTSREPRLLPRTDDATAFIPLYDDITQVGLDLQWTREAWLFKFEGLIRDTPLETFTAAVGGFEYTLFGVTDAGADLGLLLEIQYDGRSSNPGLAPVTTADQDLFVGTRFAFNDASDSALLAGFVTDLGNGSTASIIEASTRIAENWTLEIEGRLFPGSSEDDPLNFFRKDSFFNINFTRYF